VTSARAELLRQRIAESVDARQAMLADDDLVKEVDAVAGALVDALRSGAKALFFGNGGSSMDAGHLAAELLGRFYIDRPSLPAIALSDSTAAMTAIGNDYGYADVFARQIAGLGRAGDVAIGLSTSGDSENVLRALEAANDRDMITVAMTGRRGGKAATVARHTLRMPTDDTPRVQECQMLVGHTICELVERELNTT
jgi:D-sedoheptulose 7-phosphate isomerase